MGKETKADVVSIRVSDGDTVTVDGLHLGAIYTPGHTDGGFDRWTKSAVNVAP